MNYEPNELLDKLQEALANESHLIEQIRVACAEPDASWVDDTNERANRMKSLARISAQLVDAQAASAALMNAWNEVQSTPPDALRHALEVKRQVLVAAVAAIRQVEEQTEISKGALLPHLTQANHIQEMLGAYRQR